MLSMMMGNQRMLGVSPVPTEMQMMINNVPSSQELLQRPEAQAIIQGLQQGEITRQHLIQQLQVSYLSLATINYTYLLQNITDFFLQKLYF